MGTVIDFTAAIWRRIAALEMELAECPQVPPAPRSSCTVVDFTAALWRRVVALELEVAECRRAISQAPRSSWRHKVYAAELLEAERRLSIAEGMRREMSIGDNGDGAEIIDSVACPSAGRVTR
jgi:hypothetical protein